MIVCCMCARPKSYSMTFYVYSHGNILRPFARQKHRRIGGSGLPRYFQEINMLMLQKQTIPCLSPQKCMPSEYIDPLSINMRNGI